MFVIKKLFTHRTQQTVANSHSSPKRNKHPGATPNTEKLTLSRVSPFPRPSAGVSGRRASGVPEVFRGCRLVFVLAARGQRPVHARPLNPLQQTIDIKQGGAFFKGVDSGMQIMGRHFIRMRALLLCLVLKKCPSWNGGVGGYLVLIMQGWDESREFLRDAFLLKGISLSPLPLFYEVLIDEACMQAHCYAVLCCGPAHWWGDGVWARV